MKNLLSLLILLPPLFLSGQTKEVPFTLDDRDRLIRNEAAIQSLRNEMNSLRNEMNYKFESLQTQISDIKTFLFWGFGILFSMMVFLFGFVLWDRRTTVAPVKRENERIIKALTDYSENHPKLAEILRNAGIL